MSASKGYGGPSIHRYTHKTISDVGSGGDQGGGGNAGGGASVAGGGGGSPRGGVPKPNIAWVKQSQQQSMSPKKQAVRKHEYETFGLDGGSNVSRKQGKSAPKGPSESQMSKAAANPAYQTLFGAKSGVFDQAGGQKGTLTTQQLGTKSATNPAYATLYDAKSDIFAKQGGGASKRGKTLARPPEQSGGYRS